MGDYEHVAAVTADAEALFSYLSDRHNLPEYFSAMRDAEPIGAPSHGGAEVHVVADVAGTRRVGEA